MKNRDFFEIVRTLNHEEFKVYTTLDKLSQNKDYVYAGNKYLSEKIEISETVIEKIISDLIKRKYLFYLKADKEFKVFTEKHKFFNYLKQMGNKKETRTSVRAILPLTEKEDNKEDVELEKAVDEAYNNLNEVELFELYDEAEEKYKKALNAPYGDYQKKYFELLKEVYMKLVLKERIKSNIEKKKC